MAWKEPGRKQENQVQASSSHPGESRGRRTFSRVTLELRFYQIWIGVVISSLSFFNFVQLFLWKILFRRAGIRSIPFTPVPQTQQTIGTHYIRGERSESDTVSKKAAVRGEEPFF